LEELRPRPDRRVVRRGRRVPVPPLRRARAGPYGGGPVLARRAGVPRRLYPGRARLLRRQLPGGRGGRGRRGGRGKQHLPDCTGRPGGEGLRQLLRDPFRLGGPLPGVYRVVHAAAPPETGQHPRDYRWVRRGPNLIQARMATASSSHGENSRWTTRPSTMRATMAMRAMAMSAGILI